MSGDRPRYGLKSIDKMQHSCHGARMSFVFEAVLGDILVNDKVLVGGRNSTRWIINVTLKPEGSSPDPKRIMQELPGVSAVDKGRDFRSVSFQLSKNQLPYSADMLSFSFGPRSANFYRAAPHLDFEEGRIYLNAFDLGEPVVFQISLDAMHSMHR